MTGAAYEILPEDCLVNQKLLEISDVELTQNEENDGVTEELEKLRKEAQLEAESGIINGVYLYDLQVQLDDLQGEINNTIFIRRSPITT
jgi:hypothetical protein